VVGAVVRLLVGDAVVFKEVLVGADVRVTGAKVLEGGVAEGILEGNPVGGTTVGAPGEEAVGASVVKEAGPTLGARVGVPPPHSSAGGLADPAQTTVCIQS
jgi:hypothetical protein